MVNLSRQMSDVTNTRHFKNTHFKDTPYNLNGRALFNCIQS